MAANAIDVLENLLVRMHGLAPQLGTDVAWVGKEGYDLMILNLLISSVTLRIIQQLAPTTVTDAALNAAFDAALTTSAGQSWTDVIKRITLLGSDPDSNPWLGS